MVTDKEVLSNVNSYERSFRSDVLLVNNSNGFSVYMRPIDSRKKGKFSLDGRFGDKGYAFVGYVRVLEWGSDTIYAAKEPFLTREALSFNKRRLLSHLIVDWMVYSGDCFENNPTIDRQ
jgi:hypothetical protein